MFDRLKQYIVFTGHTFRLNYSSHRIINGQIEY